MRKTVSAVCIALCLSVLLAAFAPVFVFAAESSYEIKSVKTYLYSMDRYENVSCMFKSDLPEVPFLTPEDYLSRIFTGSVSAFAQPDGTYCVVLGEDVMIVSAEQDLVYFANYDSFTGEPVQGADSVYRCDYLQSAGDSCVLISGPVTLNLGAYGIDIAEADGKPYLPLPTLSDIFAATYNNAEYVGDCLYFLHAMESSSPDGYFNKRSVYETLVRSEALAEFTYSEFCFAVDHFYGRPSKAPIASLVAEMGLDAALQELSDDTRTARQLLRSRKTIDLLIGLCLLSEAFSDGGHTVLYFEALTDILLYQNTAVAKEWLALLNGSKTDANFTKAIAAIRRANAAKGDENLVNAARTDAYQGYTSIRVWDGVAQLLTEGSTAVFVFDSFNDAVVEPFKWSVDYASANRIRNFVIDLTCNGGGQTSVVYYMLTLMTNKERQSAVYTLNTRMLPSQSEISSSARVDLNLDGAFDEKDDQVAYDFHFAMLTTKCSFSCGNLLPVLAQDSGIAVFGETSGGGTCMLCKFYLPGSHFYYSSGLMTFIRADGSDVDLGAEVDEDLTAAGADGTTDYSGLFDVARLGELTDAYYGFVPALGDVNGDGIINKTDYFMLKRYVLGTIMLSDAYISRSDVNGDGFVNSRDYLMLKRVCLRTYTLPSQQA